MPPLFRGAERELGRSAAGEEGAACFLHYFQAALLAEVRTELEQVHISRSLT